MIRFDDYTVDDDGNLWSQICQSCVNDYDVDASILDDTGKGHGICGVEGCSCEADYYIDELKVGIEV